MPTNSAYFCIAETRRKAYNVDNPVRAKRSSGLWRQRHPLQPRSGLNYYVVSEGKEQHLFTPSCALLARGYQRVRPTVLLLKMCYSFKIQRNTEFNGGICQKNNYKNNS